MSVFFEAMYSAGNFASFTNSEDPFGYFSCPVIVVILGKSDGSLCIFSCNVGDGEPGLAPVSNIFEPCRSLRQFGEVNIL